MGTTNQKTTLRVTSQTKTQRTFTRMTQGRRYDNGMTLQPASTVRGGESEGQVVIAWKKKSFTGGLITFPLIAPQQGER
jgi:hypothetical protein